jgi:hypothetical protein
MKTRVEQRWRKLLPGLAQSQARWELRHALRRANETGTPQHKLATHMGLSTVRVNQLVRQAQRDLREHRKSPVELYLESSRARTQGVAEAFLQHVTKN